MQQHSDEHRNHNKNYNPPPLEHGNSAHNDRYTANNNNILSLPSLNNNASNANDDQSDYNQSKQQQATDFVQEYLKRRDKKYFVTKEQIVIGDKTIPQETVGQVIESTNKRGSYCVVFIKPYDKIEYVPDSTPNDKLSFS